ncbi:Fibrocystin-L [Nowakowskiella sp. JEL0078]|nr:Fibrocystin-L [Nowakowskiella sp. JEL0078]
MGIKNESPTGIDTPQSFFLTVANTSFVNFDLTSGFAIAACKFCFPLDGSFETKFTQLKFINSSIRKVTFQHENHAFFTDLDGSLSEIAPGTIRPFSNILVNQPYCQHNITSLSQGEFPGSYCDSSQIFTRMALTDFWNPWSLYSRDMYISNQFGGMIVPFRSLRQTLGQGYACILLANEDYNMSWILPQTELVNPLNFQGMFYQMLQTTWVRIKIHLYQTASHFLVNWIDQDDIYSPPETNSSAGTWGFSNVTNDTWLIVNGKNQPDFEFFWQLETCPRTGCVFIPPDIPNTPSSLPNGTFYWSNWNIWPGKIVPGIFSFNNFTNSDETSNEIFSGTLGLSPDLNSSSDLNMSMFNGDIWIQSGQNVFLDTSITINNLLIQGTLQLDDSQDINITAKSILILGGSLIIGSADQPFQHSVKITINGDKSDKSVALSDQIILGSKYIAVLGTLQIYGIPRNVVWTTLAETAVANSSMLVLSKSVDWNPGEKIVIASTSYEPLEAEERVIKFVSPNGTILIIDSPLNHTHISHSETHGNRTLSMRAEVGLLSRNIVIQGDDSSQDSSFGVRIYITSGTITSPNLQIQGGYTGTATIVSAEIRQAGQRGLNSFSDYRAALAFDYGSLGLSSAVRSLVRDCSIHDVYHSAISVLGEYTDGVGSFGNAQIVTGDMPVDVIGNIAYLSIGNTFNLLADDLVVIGNLGLGTILDISSETDKMVANFAATFQLSGPNSVFQNNVAAGSQSFGFFLQGTPCDGTKELMIDNLAHSNIYGIDVFGHSFSIYDCTILDRFTTWKNWNLGVLFQVTHRVQVHEMVIADSFGGFLAISHSPLSPLQQFAEKSVLISGGLIVGSSTLEAETCIGDIKAPSVVPSWISPRKKTGIIFSMFKDNTQKDDFLTLGFVQTHPQVNGFVRVEGLTFANFNLDKCGDRAAAISNCEQESDSQRSHYLKNISFSNVEHESKIFYYDPLLSWKNNPDFCMNMDCDGPKHSLVVDTDGSFLGNGSGRLTAAVARAELRFPTELVPALLTTLLNGTRVSTESIAKGFGIYRNPSCFYQEHWNAYQCFDQMYNSLTVESMDSDSMSRRLSPTALLADEYLDLLNGPRSYQCCQGGFTCFNRLSVVWGIVAVNKTYQLTFTGSNPSRLRFHHLNAQENDAVIMNITWTSAQRLDVYINGTKQNELNTIPNLNSKSGAYFFDYIQKVFTFIIKGPNPVIISASPAIRMNLNVQITSLTDFYDNQATLLRNLVDILGIDASTIRIANVKLQSIGGNLRRDTASLVTFSIEIANIAPQNITLPPEPSSIPISPPTAPSVNLTNTTTTTANDNSSVVLFLYQIQQFQTQAVETLRLQNISNQLSIQIQNNPEIIPMGSLLEFSVETPPIPVVPPLPVELQNTTISDYLTTSVNISSILNPEPVTNSSDTVQIPVKLILRSKFGSMRYTGVLPDLVIGFIDAKGQNVNELVGSWFARVSVSGSDVLINGAILVHFVNGVATFSGLKLASSVLNISLVFVSVVGNVDGKWSLSTDKFDFFIENSTNPATPVATITPISLLADSTVWIIVGVVAAVILITGVAGIFLWRKKKSKKSKAVVAPEIKSKNSKFNSNLSLGPDEEAVVISQAACGSAQRKPGFYVVKRDFRPNEFFPDELALVVGELVHVGDMSLDKEWYVGHSMKKNRSGRFPARCVEPMDTNSPRYLEVSSEFYALQKLPPIHELVTNDHKKIQNFFV